VQVQQIKDKHVKYASPPAPSKMLINQFLFEHYNINKHPGFCSVAIVILIILWCYVVSKCQAPISQWHGAISQKNRDL